MSGVNVYHRHGTGLGIPWIGRGTAAGSRSLDDGIQDTILTISVYTFRDDLEMASRTVSCLDMDRKKGSKGGYAIVYCLHLTT